MAAESRRPRRDRLGAERDLHRAREIRERIGEQRALATTNCNLQALCEQLQQMVRKDELMRSGAERDSGQMRDESRRPSFLRLLLLGVLAALAFAGGVLAGDSGNSGRPADFPGGGGGSKPGTANPGPTTNPGGTPNPSGETATTEPTTGGPNENELKFEELKREEEELHRAQEKEEEQKRIEEAELRRAEEETARRAEEEAE